MALKGSKSPLLLSLWRGQQLLWKELAPMAWNETSIWQTLSSKPSERHGTALCNCESA